MKSTLEKSYDDIKKQKEQVKKDLQGIDLTETVTDKDGNDVLVLTDLDKEIKKIDEYEASLEKLKQSGISDSLMDEIMGLNYASGDRQAFINQLLGLSPDKLQLYYDDWERWQARQEEAATNAVADKVEETNKAAAEGVKNIFGEMIGSAYEDGINTAKSYLQGISDMIGAGIPVSSVISGAYDNFRGNSSQGTAFADKNSVSQLVAAGKLIPAESVLKIFVNDKKFIKTTVGEMFSMGQITGGNVFNL